MKDADIESTLGKFGGEEKLIQLERFPGEGSF